MEEKKETVVQNIEEGIGSEVEETKPAAENVVDDDIQYTFVVPKGEIYRDPDLEPSETDEPEPAESTDAEAEPDDAEAEPAQPEKTIVVDRSSFTEEVNNALADAAEEDEGFFFDSDEDFFDTYKAADPAGRPTLVEPPVYAATGLPDEDDFITYTFVVPKGEIYTEPDPEEERAEREAEGSNRQSCPKRRRSWKGSMQMVRMLKKPSTGFRPIMLRWASWPRNRRHAGFTKRERKTVS